MKVKVQTETTVTKCGNLWEYAVNGVIYQLTLEELKKLHPYDMTPAEQEEYEGSGGEVNPDGDPTPEPEPAPTPTPTPVDPEDEDGDEDEDGKEDEGTAKEYKVFFKDTLRGGSIFESDFLVWDSTTDFSLNVYMTGPEGEKVYPEIDRGFTKYTTKEELTARGPKIGFNRLNALPIVLQGEDIMTAVGKDLGPGSRSAGGFTGDLVFRTESGKEVIRIPMKCAW